MPPPTYGGQQGIPPQQPPAYGQAPGAPYPGQPPVYGQQPPAYPQQQPPAYSQQQPPAYPGQQPPAYAPQQPPAYPPQQPGVFPPAAPGFAPSQQGPYGPQPIAPQQPPGIMAAPGEPYAPEAVRVSRGADSTAVTRLLLMLPNFFGSLLVILMAASLMPSGLDVVFVIVWLASGALVFSPAVERVLAKMLFRWREPTGAERAAMEPLWARVTQRAGIKNSKYELWVEDSEEINAAAAAGHMVGVTRWALKLPPERLEAILAHELGHHLGGHAWAGLLGQWYALPGRLVMVLARWLLLVVAVVAQAVPLLGCLVGLVFVAVVLGVAFAFPPILVVFVTPYLLAWAGRSGELRADRSAAQLGYGPALHAVFSEWQGEGADDGRRDQKVLDRLLASHPPMHERIRELEKFAGAIGH
ncbi:M48 family metalloprotease [Streptomyces sp. P9(2023)]|uniref:M48 family metalloprotease n=1 Tax=Streptomyces sp. P9(2023) TaxID=3064394 RepID=UPI0028F3E56C|nr:M48 family metalloprotease [Streptomyces sp. P9(2023)]MDT9692491.1 M48 family metalloprotease [Streptomyces sp. P9(2023)]